MQVQHQHPPAAAQSSGTCLIAEDAAAVHAQARTLSNHVQEPTQLSATAPVCACFGLTEIDIEADIQDGTPRRIRQLYVQSQSADAKCQVLAVDGQCCLREVQRIYMKLQGMNGR